MRIERSAVILASSLLLTMGAPAAFAQGQSITIRAARLIDVHVHIGQHFNRSGRASNEGETPAERALYAMENAWVTLINGFTTVQSVGAAADKDLRDAIARGVLPGPRILSSLSSIGNAKLTPDQIREEIRARKKDGADLVKI